MFHIITTNGVELGYTEQVRYIKINERNGCFNACNKNEAIGIAFQSNPYNLFGHSEIAEAETVIVVEVDSGSEIYTTKDVVDKLTRQLAETDEAAIELYEANLILKEHNAEQDEAIIQLYEQMERN